MSTRRTTKVPAAPSRGRSSLAVVRALASVLVLLAALVGLPVLLGWATPQVWEASRSDLTHLLDRQDTGGALLMVLLAIGWITWAHFAVSVLVETAAQLRGRAAHRRQLLGPSQRLAALLVGSVLVLLPTSSALATPALATPAAASPHTGHADSPAAAHAQQAKASAADSSRTYTVREMRPAETLGSIAERELGSFDAWHEIADANDGRVMADGSTFDARFLRPGWKLLLPEAPPGEHTGGQEGMRPAAAHTPKPVAETADGTYTVRTGDNLSDISEKTYGDPSRYPDIARANREKVPDPDLIYPGQKLTLPDAPESAPPAGNGGEPEQPKQRPGHEAEKPSPDRDGPQADRPDPSKSAPADRDTKPDKSEQDKDEPGKEDRGKDRQEAGQPAPQHTPAPHASGTAKPGTERPAPASPPQTPKAGPSQGAGSTGEEPSGAVSAPHILGAGALLAAGLCGALGVKRILQQRRRRPGETIAITEPAAAEQRMTAAGEPGSVERLDTALRALAHHTAASGAALPQLRAARVTSRSVQILLDDPEPAAPPAPFVPVSDGWWEAGPDTALPPGEQLAMVPAPYPGLVTAGSGESGEHLLLHLPHVRTLLLDGTPQRVREVTRAIALDAATCAWSDHAEILTVGLGDELPTLLPKGRLRAVPDVAAATRDLGEVLVEAHQRAAEDDPAGPLPWLLVCAAQADPDQAWALADALAAARSAPVALVLPAEGLTSVFPEAERLDAGQDGPQPCPVIGQPLRLNRVTDQDYAQLVDSLRTTEEPAHPAEAEWQHVPGAAPPATAPPPAPPAPPTVAVVRGEAKTTAGEEAAPFPALLAAVKDPAHLPKTPAPRKDTEPATALHLHDEEDSGAQLPGQAPDAEPDAPEEDPDAPEIRVLGPVEVTGVAASGHGYKLAALAALIYLRPGRGAEELCEAMDPNRAWSKATLQSRVSELRARLGTSADGGPYLPRDRQRLYRLSPQVRCDWTRFQALARRGLAQGPEHGLPDLEAALALVRGRPLSGPSGADLSWAAPLIQEMLSRITDVAHTIATWRRTGPHPDLAAARHAVITALAVDDTADVLYQDWMRIEEASGNRAGVYQAVEQLQAVCRRLDVEILPETEAVIDDILSSAKRTSA